MTATPVLFRQSIENLFGKGNLSPFLEAATNAFSAVFEAANSISRKQAATALSKLPAYKGTPYENIEGWEGTDLATMRDAYNKYIAKGNRSQMINEVAEDEPTPRKPATQQAVPQAQPKPQQQPQQPKADTQPTQNKQAQNNNAATATRQNTNAIQQNTSVQQPQPVPSQQPKATAQPATTSNAHSAQHSTQNQNRAPAPQPQQQQKTQGTNEDNLLVKTGKWFGQQACELKNARGHPEVRNAEKKKCAIEWQ